MRQCARVIRLPGQNGSEQLFPVANVMQRVGFHQLFRAGLGGVELAELKIGESVVIPDCYGPARIQLKKMVGVIDYALPVLLLRRESRELLVRRDEIRVRRRGLFKAGTSIA